MASLDSWSTLIGFGSHLLHAKVTIEHTELIDFISWSNMSIESMPQWEMIMGKIHCWYCLTEQHNSNWPSGWLWSTVFVNGSTHIENCFGLWDNNFKQVKSMHPSTNTCGWIIRFKPIILWDDWSTSKNIIFNSILNLINRINTWIKSSILKSEEFQFLISFKNWWQA